MSTIRDTDVILVMRDGDIIEQGRHEGLPAPVASTHPCTRASLKQLGFKVLTKQIKDIKISLVIL